MQLGTYIPHLITNISHVIGWAWLYLSISPVIAQVGLYIGIDGQGCGF